MFEAERSAVLDLCDEAAGTPCERGRRWPWLRDEAGEQVAADGWWPELGVVVILSDGGIDAKLLAILRTIDAHEMESLAFEMRTLISEGACTPARRADYVTMFRMILTDPARRWMHRHELGIVPDTFGIAVGEIHGEAFEADDEDEPYLLEDDDEFELSEWIEAPRPELGWRMRPVLLALLEAAALTRRSTQGGPLDPLEMQALAALAAVKLDIGVAEEQDSRNGLAALLAADAGELQFALDGLVARELATFEVAIPGDHESEGWSITETGIAAVETWVAHCIGLFGGWPPEHLGADDAIG